ncbi:hypothetical protein O6H91_09G062900 [Diphasiastrum complanatum]|uniref:Uncharacterized protein n=1 Tax=Diphasiastrum complanatum TaxID=34168 RepID=A0ACC2CPU9_DIPCM|nr:hypothetical protein O6H91_09G062900 [Diphasiastrum complanatum]
MDQSASNSFLLPIVDAVPISTKHVKVTVVGIGNVGMACAQTILTQELAEEIALVDVEEKKLKGEMLDLQHAGAFVPRTKITADTDYAISAGSDICIVTAGARQREGESRLSLLERNVSIYKSIIPRLVEHSPNTILLIVSNPVDILSYLAWKISGLPPNRVIGSGTNLDSSRFRFLLAERLNVHVQNVSADIIGEHGDSSVPMWSSVTVGGIPLNNFLDKNINGFEMESLRGIHTAVVNGAHEVISLKGYTSWAIGYSTANLTRTLLKNQQRIHPVSVYAKGLHGIEEDVFLSLPVQLGRSGVQGMVNAPLAEEEKNQLKSSAQALWQAQQGLSF